MISMIVSAIGRHTARSRAVEMLSRYDDHRLRDIGISRDQIELFVAGRL